uniref:Pentatricopeptide repeat-containing protein At1g12700, mitochondrial n=1 Tax=Nicotiana tabacum TaxID=4097 RepID=A0A1S4CT58_TOBAC|nr:PREDICTED: putative pentatricopeptide repeat-containing protein At1g12700, mitochondrial [Nicotiana tabacum]
MGTFLIRTALVGTTLTKPTWVWTAPSNNVVGIKQLGDKTYDGDVAGSDTSGAFHWRIAFAIEDDENSLLRYFCKDISCFAISRPCSAITIRDYSSSQSNTSISSAKGKCRFDNVKCLDDAVSLFRRMVRTQPLPSVFDFSQLLKTMVNMKHYSAVVSLFGELLKSGIPIDGFILSIAINNYCLMHRSDCGFSVLAIYLKNGIPFNVVTFSTILRGLFAESKIKDAVNLFKKLVRENICEPDEFMYSIIMNGLSKRGHTQKTFDLLRVMEQGSTKPNAYIYSIVIDALCKDRMLDAAISLFEEMKQKGIPPNVVTYSSLIDGLCKLGQWEKVRTLFFEMVNLNIYPDVRTFNILTDGLCKEGKVEDAEEVMRHMNGKGVEPNVVTYNVIIDGYCLSGQMDKARRLFDTIIVKSIKPGIVSYNTLINGYCKNNKLDDAMDWFHEISRNGLEHSIVTYNTILQSLLEVGRIDFAQKFFAEMLSIGLKPDLCTNRILLGGYFQNGLLEKAMSLFHELEVKREDTDIEFYTIIIDGLCKNDLDPRYSNFNDIIIHPIIDMDVDVITIVTFRSGEKFLFVFREGVNYGTGIALEYTTSISQGFHRQNKLLTGSARSLIPTFSGVALSIASRCTSILKLSPPSTTWLQLLSSSAHSWPAPRELDLPTRQYLAF